MSKVMRGYRYKIYPTENQAKQIDDYINFTRFVYNWGVAKEREILEQHEQGLSKYKFYSYFDLDKLFREEIKTNPKLYFAQKYPNTTTKLALRRVISGYERFFNGQNKNKPHFKKKNKCKKSFNTRDIRFNIKDNSVKIEGFKTRISLGFNSGLKLDKVINPVVTKNTLGEYYISFSLEEESKDLEISKTEGIGIDLGVRQTFALSNGEIYNQPKEKLEKLERRRSRQERYVTRDRKRRMKEAARTKTKYEDIPKSKRAIKREQRLNKIYKKIHNIKNTFYHTITKRIVEKNPEYVCMETIPIREIQKNEPYMNDKIVQVSFYDITQKMKYKCENYNIQFIQAPTYFASTQICSNCCNKQDMDGKHTYKCPVCGMIEDRDINAAINLRNYGSQFII